MDRIVFLWGYIRQWKRQIAMALIGLAFISLTSLLYPWLLKLMVDQFSGHTSSGVSVDKLCLILALAFALSAVVGYYQELEMRTLGHRLRNTLRAALYQSLLSRPMSFHRKEQVGELSSRATEDIGKLQLVFSGLLSPAVQNTLFVTGCLLMMALLNWVATVGVVALVMVPIPFVYLLSRTIRRLTAQSQTDHAHANAFLEESLVAMREIKAFVREKLELQRYTRLLDRASTTEAHASRLHVKMNQAVYLLFSGALLLIFYTGTRGTLFPDWTLGDVIAFYFYSYTMTMALLSTGKIYLSYQEFAGALGRVIELLSGDHGTFQSSDSVCAEPVRGTVVFRNVSFSYDAAPFVLNDISLAIRAGEWQLITGPSGSGKSTMASLLMGFYRPVRGSILVDDIPLEQWNMDSLRRQIGFVGQDPMLFHGTLRDNICFAATPVTEKQLAWAIEMSCLDDVLRALPQGLNTIVGERGYTLSGGQKARVAVARAILNEPPILLLDEANAMLERELEQRFWRNLASSRAGKTTIIFSHHYQHIPEIYHAIQLDQGVLRPLARNVGPRSFPYHASAITGPEV